MTTDKFVTPGLKLAPESKYTPGQGVYAKGGDLFASLAGTLVEDAPSPSSTKPTLRVAPPKSGKGTPPFPKLHSTVTCKITKVTPRQASAELLVVDSRPLPQLFKGIIRQQDVRQTEVDKVDIYKCFVPGDVVSAEVISLGDRHSYLLSTAKNHLGVIYAKSRSGIAMFPVNWQQMQCPVSKVREFRKVAKQ